MTLPIEGLTPLLEVFDVAASIEFYRRLAGFATVETAGPPGDLGFAFLRHESGIELMLNSAYEAHERPATPDPARVAAHADTILYLACPDVNAAYAHLRTQGIPAQQPTVAHYGMKQLYLRDPDGYAICFQWPERSERRTS